MGRSRREATAVIAHACALLLKIVILLVCTEKMIITKTEIIMMPPVPLLGGHFKGCKGVL